MKLHENIRKFRIGKNLTQEAVADTIGVTAQAVSKWERGESLPDAAMIPVLADVLGISTDELYGFDGVSKSALLRSLKHYMRQNPADFWQMMHEIGYCAILSGMSDFREPDEIQYEADNAEHHNCCELSDSGMMKFTSEPDFPYCFFAPRPENGWTKAFADERIRKYFAALGDEMTVRALRWLYMKKPFYHFEFPVLLEKADIPAEAGDRVRRNLLDMKILHGKDVDIDGVVRSIFTYYPKPGFLAAWMLLRDYQLNDMEYEYQSTRHQKPMMEDAAGSL